MPAKRGSPLPPAAAPAVAPGFVAVGRVLASWGLHGHLKVQPLTPFPDRFQAGRSLYLGGQRRLIESARWQKGTLYLKLSGLEDRPAAEAFRGHYLQVPESDLQPLGQGQYYHYQLIGVAVRSSKGLPLGRVTRILSTPSNDVFVVHGMLGELLIPAIDDVVKEIDLEKSLMTIELIPGLVPKRGGKANIS